MICKHPNPISIPGAKKQKLCKCKACGLIYNPQLLEKLNKYENYYDSEGFPNRFNPFVEMVVLCFRFLRVLKIKSYKWNIKKILDIGCGRGIMLYLFSKLTSADVEGIQIEKNSFEYAKEKLKLNMYNKDLLDLNLSDNSYDFISYWHVFEHLQFPQEHIKKVNSLLNKEGILLIEVPNYNAWTRKLTTNGWLSFDPDNHIYFFTKDSLVKLANKYGFELTYYQSFSLEYSTFTSCQSIINYLTGTENTFFNWLLGKNKGGKIIFLHIFLFILLLPFCFIVNLLLYKSQLGEVNHCVFKKKTVL
jgi:2-polyprenyl-3-methyl-5-hydroxy-6-metoxy-1,4-benzoquinol methylase